MGIGKTRNELSYIGTVFLRHDIDAIFISINHPTWVMQYRRNTGVKIWGERWLLCGAMLVLKLDMSSLWGWCHSKLSLTRVAPAGSFEKRTLNQVDRMYFQERLLNDYYNYCTQLRVSV